MQNQMFDMVEELAGTYPDSDSLRNAIYSVITKGMEPAYGGVTNYGSKFVVNPVAARNVEHLARNYEHVRGISMTVGPNPWRPNRYYTGGRA